MFAKAGAIVPQTVLKPHSNKTDASDEMTVTVFPGASNAFTLYEDEGDYQKYENGAYANTQMQLEYSDSKAIFTIHSAQGDQSLIPEKRKWNVQFRGFTKTLLITVTVDGKEVDCQSSYDEPTHTTTVEIQAAVNAAVVIAIEAKSLIHDNSDKVQKCFEIIRETQINFWMKENLYNEVKDEQKHIRERIEGLYGKIPSMSYLANALKEQLILEHDEFYDMEF